MSTAPLIAFTVPVPAFGLLEYSVVGIAALLLAVGWGNAVQRRVVRMYVLLSVATSLAALALYVAISAIPLYVRPWGTTTIAWAALNLTWLVVMELRIRDYALCVAGLMTAVLLAVAVADVLGISGRAAGIVFFTLMVAPLLLLCVRGWVHTTVGWSFAYRFFQWIPDNAEPRAQGFYADMLARAERQHDRRDAALAKVGLARCRFVSGEREVAITELAAAVEDLGGLDPMWSCVAQRLLAEWLVLTYGAEHSDEAEELAGASLALARGFARAHLLLPRTLLIRGVCRYTRGDAKGAHEDAAEAEQILRRHKDANVEPFVRGFLGVLARDAQAGEPAAS